MKKVWIAAVILSLASAPVFAGPEPQQSPRMERAKDYIAEEQWDRAIEQLTAAAADPKERQRDEALFWLAHSQNQSHALAAAVQTISELEKRFPASRWVKPARSLRIEIAQKLRRSDVLWFTAQPAPPARAPQPAAPTETARPSRRLPPAPPAPVAMPAPTPAPAVPPAPPIPAPPAIWFPDGWEPDMGHRIQALGSLMETDAPRVIPILKEIALASPDADEARRAVFVLAQSGRPDAHVSVLDLARKGSESVQIAAVRELGRFGAPDTFGQLLQIYGTGNPRVKYQIVTSLGARAATDALLRIAETESDQRLQASAIKQLGESGARESLQRLYWTLGPALKRPIIEGLFNARADEELIGIAEKERDVTLRTEAVTRLRLLGTSRARAYFADQQKKR